ncbi:MAG: histidine kinase, partial [Thermoanaerobaculia bacterium]
MSTRGVGRLVRGGGGSLARVIAWRERRLFREVDSKLRRLIEWSPEIPADEISVIREGLRHLREVFRSPRALMIWEIADEPYVNLALAERDEFEVTQEPPERFAPVLAPDLAEATVFLGREHALRYGRGAVERTDLASVALHPELRERFGIATALSVPVRSRALEGRLFALDLKRVARFDFLLAELLAAVVAARSEQVGQVALARGEAVAEERSRIARDLHDGLLQSFTGTVLQLEVVHDLVERDPLQARRRLTEIEASIMNDQRE